MTYIDEDLKAFNCNLSRGIDKLCGSFEGVALDFYFYFLRKKFCIILLFIRSYPTDQNLGSRSSPSNVVSGHKTKASQFYMDLMTPWAIYQIKLSRLKVLRNFREAPCTTLYNLKYSVRKGKKTLNGKAIHWNILKII
jgi:hypothetical protein